MRHSPLGFPAGSSARSSCGPSCGGPPRRHVPLFEGKWGAASLSVLVFLLPLEGAARVSSRL